MATEHAHKQAHAQHAHGGARADRGDGAASAPAYANGRQRHVRAVLLVVLALNICSAVARIVIGYLTGSLAIGADGVNALLDGGGNIIALLALAIASRPPDENHPYGHGRFETLATLGIAGLMLVTMAGIVQAAWSRLQSNAAPDVTLLSFAVMLATLGVTIFVTLFERRAARRYASRLLAADARHTATDILVSSGVIASLIGVRLGFARADAVVSLLIAAVIAWSAWTIVRDASLVLTDATVEERARIERAVRSVAGVRGTHNIRSRGGEGAAWVDLHIQVDPRLSVDQGHEIASRVAERVEEEIGETADVTVHIEPADERHLREERGYTPGVKPPT